MAGTLDLWVHGLGEHKASPCLCIPCNQAKVSNSNEKRLSVWTTADGVLVFASLSFLQTALVSQLFPFSIKSQILMGLCALVYM